MKCCKCHLGYAIHAQTSLYRSEQSICSTRREYKLIKVSLRGLEHSYPDSRQNYSCRSAAQPAYQQRDGFGNSRLQEEAQRRYKRPFLVRDSELKSRAHRLTYIIWQENHVLVRLFVHKAKATACVSSVSKEIVNACRRTRNIITDSWKRDETPDKDDQQYSRRSALDLIEMYRGITS